MSAQAPVISITLVPLAVNAGEDLRRRLESKGMFVRIVNGEDTAELIKTEEDTIYVVIKENNQKLPSFSPLDKPMLLISDKHVAELKELEAIFGPVLGLPRFAPPRDVIDAISVLNDMSFEKKKHAIAQANIAQAEAVPSEAVQPKQIHSIADVQEPPAALGRYLLSLKKRGPLGGFNYASMHSIERPLTPTRFVILDGVITDSLAGVGRWQRSHAIRVATIAPLLAAPVIEDKKLLDEIMLAGLLIPKAIKKEHSILLRKDYTGKGSTLARAELASIMKDSALQLTRVIGAEHISSLIATSARYIGREQPVEDSAEGIAASAIVAADCIDRLVYFTGFFRPEPAHRILRGITTGTMKDFHPAISCNLIKFLAEAMSVIKSVEIDRVEIPEPLETEQTVKLQDLIPGMRLSRPLNAFDGKALIDADVELDEDLILRIWQLSTLRAIRSAFVLN